VLNLLVVLILLAITGYGMISGRLAAPSFVLVRLTGLLAAVLLTIWLARRPHGRWIELLVTFYPIALIPVVFDSLQPLIEVLGFPNQDAALIAIDRKMLGDDAAVILRPFIRPWLSDLLHIAYCSYFVFPIIVGVSAWLRSRWLGQRFIFTIVLAFYVSYAGYFFVPALGPRYAQWPLTNEETHYTPISHVIYYGLNSVENTRNDVFPSGHILVTAVCLMAAYGFSRRLFWVLLPAGAGLCFATLYCRYHYFVDVLAGLLLAGIVLPVGYAIFSRATTPSPSYSGERAGVRGGT